MTETSVARLTPHQRQAIVTRMRLDIEARLLHAAALNRVAEIVDDLHLGGVMDEWIDAIEQAGAGTTPTTIADTGPRPFNCRGCGGLLLTRAEKLSGTCDRCVMRAMARAGGVA